VFFWDIQQVWYTRQTIGNACGTIGVLHAVGNNLNEYSIDPDSWFGKFFQATRDMTPEQRASHLETDDSLEGESLFLFLFLPHRQLY
jgi:ubiquitin carboxyl-terminal hydrolase L3